MSELVGSHLLCVCVPALALVLWEGGREQHGAALELAWLLKGTPAELCLG